MLLHCKLRKLDVMLHITDPDATCPHGTDGSSCEAHNQATQRDDVSGFHLALPFDLIEDALMGSTLLINKRTKRMDGVIAPLRQDADLFRQLGNQLPILRHLSSYSDRFASVLESAVQNRRQVPQHKVNNEASY
jgi:hypothetical protein